MDLNIHYAFLPQTDPDEALAFYRDTLGWELRNDVGYNGMRWLTVGPAGQPTSVVLYPPDAEQGLTDEERSTVAEMIAKGSYARITFASPDLDRDFEKLAAAGVEVVEEPTDQPYGVRDCAVRDPSGNLIRINQLA
jgi:catechol 2,3-dioxygenase-like lactoylglutathione lyase family enzyme